MKISIHAENENAPVAAGYNRTTQVCLTAEHLDGKMRDGIMMNWPGAFSEPERLTLEQTLHNLLSRVGVITEAEYQERISHLENEIECLRLTLRDERARADKAVYDLKVFDDKIEKHGLRTFMKLIDTVNETKSAIDKLADEYTDLRYDIQRLDRGV